jgi:hypothetical protein
MQGQFVGQDTQPFQDDSGRRYVVQAAWFAVCLAFWKWVFSDPNPCGRHRQITQITHVDVRSNDRERVREVPVDFFSV